jgi:hypothetical protein
VAAVIVAVAYLATVLALRRRYPRPTPAGAEPLPDGDADTLVLAPA